MTFEPLNIIAVCNIDTTIDVVSRGDGSHAQDDVFVTVGLDLVGEIDASEPATLILPLASEAQQQPLLRYTDDPIRGAQVFTFDEVERSVYDQQVVDRLEKLGDGASKKEQRAVATATESSSSRSSDHSRRSSSRRAAPLALLRCCRVAPRS